MFNTTADIRQTTQAAPRIATQDGQAATSSEQEAQHVADQASQANPIEDQTIEGAIENNSKAIAAQNDLIKILMEQCKSQATSIESLALTLSSVATLIQIGTAKIEQRGQKIAKIEYDIGSLHLKYGKLLHKGASDSNSSGGFNDSDVDARSNTSEVAELKRDQVLGSPVILTDVKSEQLLRPEPSSPEAQGPTMSELVERIVILEETLAQLTKDFAQQTKALAQLTKDFAQQTKAFAQQTKLVAQQNEFLVQVKKKAKEEETILDRVMTMIEKRDKTSIAQQEEMNDLLKKIITQKEKEKEN